MSKGPLIRLGAAALGGLFAAAVLLALLLVVNAGAGFEGSTIATPLGWTIPLIAGVLVAGLAWLLLTGGRERREARPQASVSCPECGKPCLDSWRLCPFCGTLLGQTARRRS